MTIKSMYFRDGFHDFWQMCTHVATSLINVWNIAISPENSLKNNLNFKIEINFRNINIQLKMGESYSILGSRD